MATKQLMRDQSTTTEPVEAGSEAMGPAVMAAAASVGLSWYYFFLKGEKERGLFVGLWPPTILAFASYFMQHRMNNRLSMITEPGRSIKQTIDSVMGNA
ncbi:hypothetical protein [Halovivax cerinus]|uniref:Uncharacterized protein n=1 Tax=Halovivax cerinus TaxID=1487865 RepID=A0ABD5NSB7_9EURY|nr:hypothetical protein [Halovivax cerinus]